MERSERLALLLHAEAGLSDGLEELRNRPSDSTLELAVEVDERTAEPVGDLGADRRLARAHEADQREVPF